MGSKPSVMMIKPPIGFLLGLNPLIPKLVAEVLTNERVCAQCRGRQESSAARNLALSNLARIVRHSLGLKSVKDSVRPGIGGDFSRAQIASSSAGRSNRPPGRDRCVSSDDGFERPVRRRSSGIGQRQLRHPPRDSRGFPELLVDP
jgi:hypothetical protein